MKISISENLLNNPGYLIYDIKAIYVVYYILWNHFFFNIFK